MAMRALFSGIFLISLLIAVITGESKNRILYQKLEDALTGNKTALYEMQETFFPLKGSSRDVVYFNVCVAVGNVQPGSYDNSSLTGGQNNFTYCKRFQWSSSALVDLISVDQLLILDNLLSEVIIHVIEHQNDMELPLHIYNLPYDIKDDDILTALMRLLPWVKAYARMHHQPNKNDKGYVSISYNKYVIGSYEESDTNAHFYRITVLCAFIFLNILTPIALAKSVSVYYPKTKTESLGFGYLYWATAILAFLFNPLYFGTSIVRSFSIPRPLIVSCIVCLSDHCCKIPSDTSVYHDEVLTLVAKITIVPISVFTELVISIFAVKYRFCDQRSLKCGCHSWRHCFMLMVHVLALWNILIAIQTFIIIAIPISVLLWIFPQLTIIHVIFILMMPISFTLIVAYILYQCQRPRKKMVGCNTKHCGKCCAQLLAIIAILGLVFTALILYEFILQVQVEAGSGLRGIVLTLLPSFPLSALGWYLKRRSQMKTNKSAKHETMQQEKQGFKIAGDSSDEELLSV